MAANAILRRNKTSIVDTLCADYTLILNKADQNELITQREYKNLKSINQKDKEGHVVELLDKIMDKGEKTCLAFLNVLQTDEEIQKTYPELNNILKKENCPLPYPVQACSVDNTVKDAGVVKCSEPGSRNTAGPSAGGTAQYTMVDGG
ncbi:Caspase recruitment domain containing protein 6 [Dissostichus eleginoides]|uniref:Caspase recruitment domain containing protein 6 n=1 Tax=Dissostichus eleginoides TaxID=100907 RepID=A0AAD9C428_DISEL|nr:Caspase recruitment domain containing protein 6 [Dissostichus eleginoides]